MDRTLDRRAVALMVGALVVVPGIALVAAPAGVAQDASPEASPDASPEASPEASPGASPVAGDQVEVVSFDIYFEPTEVTIPADTDVAFVLPNEGVTAHNFAIDELGIDVDIAPGATEETVVNAPAGTYEYYCNVPGHKAAGMVGTLTVE